MSHERKVSGTVFTLKKETDGMPKGVGYSKREGFGRRTKPPIQKKKVSSPSSNDATNNETDMRDAEKNDCHTAAESTAESPCRTETAEDVQVVDSACREEGRELGNLHVVPTEISNLLSSPPLPASQVICHRCEEYTVAVSDLEGKLIQRDKDLMKMMKSLQKLTAENKALRDNSDGAASCAEGDSAQSSDGLLIVENRQLKMEIAVLKDRLRGAQVELSEEASPVTTNAAVSDECHGHEKLISSLQHQVVALETANQKQKEEFAVVLEESKNIEETHCVETKKLLEENSVLRHELDMVHCTSSKSTVESLEQELSSVKAEMRHLRDRNDDLTLRKGLSSGTDETQEMTDQWYLTALELAGTTLEPLERAIDAIKPTVDNSRNNMRRSSLVKSTHFETDTTSLKESLEVPLRHVRQVFRAKDFELRKALVAKEKLKKEVVSLQENVMGTSKLILKKQNEWQEHLMWVVQRKLDPVSSFLEDAFRTKESFYFQEELVSQVDLLRRELQQQQVRNHVLERHLQQYAYQAGNSPSQGPEQSQQYVVPKLNMRVSNIGVSRSSTPRSPRTPRRIENHVDMDKTSIVEDSLGKKAYQLKSIADQLTMLENALATSTSDLYRGQIREQIKSLLVQSSEYSSIATFGGSVVVAGSPDIDRPDAFEGSPSMGRATSNGRSPSLDIEVSLN